MCGLKFETEEFVASTSTEERPQVCWKTGSAGCAGERHDARGRAAHGSGAAHGLRFRGAAPDPRPAPAKACRLLN